MSAQGAACGWSLPRRAVPPLMRRLRRFVATPGVRRWGAGLFAVLLAPSMVVAGDFDPAENPWGFGYDGGLTLRRKIASHWELGISGGPRDYLSNSREVSVRESPGAQTDSTVTEGEGRRESGFAALHVGRSVWQRGSFDLITYLRGGFEWTNYSDNTIYDPGGGNPRDLRTVTEDEREWSLSLGFRPGYRPVSWFSIEVAFGLTYQWTERSRTYENISYDPNGDLRRSVSYRESDGQSFATFGYRGTSSFNFIIWF